MENTIELQNISVQDLRSMIRDKRRYGAEKLQSLTGREIADISKQNAINLLSQIDNLPVPAIDYIPGPATTINGNNKAIDLIDLLPANNNMALAAPIANKTINKTNNASQLESCLIDLIKQNSTNNTLPLPTVDPTISEKNMLEIKSLIDSKFDEIKKSMTTTIQLTKNGIKTDKIDCCHKDTAKAIAILSSRTENKRINLFLSGGAGGGKTHSASLVAKALNVPFYPVSLHSQMTKLELIGFTSQIDNQYKMTPLAMAVKFGGLWLGDEADTANPGILNVINSVLSNDQVMLGNELVTVHKDFYCIVSGNTTGYGANRKYIGRNALDGAFLDRFVFMNWDYDENLELKLCGNKSWMEYVLTVRQAVSDLKMQFIVSPRQSIAGAMLSENKDFDFSFEEIADLTIFNKIGIDNKNKILAHILSKQKGGK